MLLILFYVLIIWNVLSFVLSGMVFSVSLFQGLDRVGPGKREGKRRVSFVGLVRCLWRLNGEPK